MTFTSSPTTCGRRTHGREDHSVPLAGTIHRCAAAFEVPLKGEGILHKLANSILRRVLAPVGVEYFWARAATRKALEVARKLPPGIVIATSPPHAALIAGTRIARRLRWPLILDYRDPWSAYDWPQWHRGWLPAVVWRAHRGAAGASQRRARAQHPRHARVVRGILSGRHAWAELRGAEWFRRGAGHELTVVDWPDRNHARRGNLRQPLAAAVAACRRSTEHAPSGASHPGDQLRRPASRGMATHSRGGSGAVHRIAAAHPVRRVVRRYADARTCCSPWSAIT